MSDSEKRTAEAIQRCMKEGSMWLNPVFRFNNRSIRILKRRFTVLEVIWGVISCLTTALILFLLSLVFGGGGPFFILFSPVAIVFWSLTALVFGRKIAFLSPLRRQTGEGTGTWLVLFVRRTITRISFTFARPVMYNYHMSRAGDPHRKLQKVECIEWLGTAHSPRAPYIDKDIESRYAEVELKPRGVTIRNHDKEGSDWRL